MTDRIKLHTSNQNVAKRNYCEYVNNFKQILNIDEIKQMVDELNVLQAKLLEVMMNSEQRANIKMNTKFVYKRSTKRTVNMFLKLKS